MTTKKFAIDGAMCATVGATEALCTAGCFALAIALA
jgi:hypothetical protein